jgi:hypothetical protein
MAEAVAHSKEFFMLTSATYSINFVYNPSVVTRSRSLFIRPYYTLRGVMKKSQLKALATKIHGLAVKSANGKKTVQNKAIEKIAALLNQAIEGDVKQAYAGIASQVRGLAEKLEPAPARKAVKRKKVTRKKPVATKKKPERRRSQVKPTEKVAEQTETTTP